LWHVPPLQYGSSKNVLSGNVSDQAGPRNPRFILHATPLI